MNTKSLVFALTATVWALAAATAVFWLLQWTGVPGRASADARQQAEIVLMPNGAQTRQVGAHELTTLLGNRLPRPGGAPVEASRFRLLGVVAQARGGAALLAADDQPPKAYRVGSYLDKRTVLQSIGPRHVVLGTGAPGDAGLRLELMAEPPDMAREPTPAEARP